MEDFSFRPSFEVEKVPPNFFSSALNYLDSLDHTKGLRPDQIPNPLQVAHEFRRRRLSSFEAPVFYPYKDEEHFPEAHDHVKTENFTQEFPQFGHHAHTDFGFEFPMSTKLQDCAVDYYRINRSRGPSFNWGPGRKNSEDLFAHGFDLLYRNFEQQNVPQELNDSKMHPTFLDAPLIPQALAGNFNSLAENNYHNHLQMQFENGHPKELATNLHQAQTGQQQPPQSAYEESQEEKTSELEAKGKKKRKTNNRQEAPVEEEAEPPVVKKVKSDNKKNAKAAEPALKSSKSMIEKPVAKKTESKSTKSKKGLEAQRTDSSFVKSEVEDQEKEEKSTEASSINVSPVPKKEDIPNIFRSKSSIAGTFGHFKKPETAQELLGGLSLPAEVEEYINNSKIFNQIKAPIIKKIGTLTLEERRIKIEKYLEKRKRRSWNKRVNYDCRKKVADNRLRIKGRFVTKDQAFSMLEACGIFPDPEKITNNEIKELLTERFGSILKKKDLFGDGQAKQGKSGKGVKAEENNKQFQFGDMGGDQDGSSVGSQDDSMSETYLRD